MTNCVHWLIGRGASIACNLSWVVPDEWNILERQVKVAKIKQAIMSEMNSPKVNTKPYKEFLGLLKNNTADGWQHLFITTNWDYLLQREIQNLGLMELPKWLANSHVFHINGTVEPLKDNSNRSPFLLEDDPLEQRVSTVEANVAYNHMTGGRLFIVIGMSFECQTDRFLLSALNRVEDNRPIGESKWLIVNPNKKVLSGSATRIQQALPGATIVQISQKFDEWVNTMMPELATEGVLAF
jgi:hypothetical protein